MQVIRKYLRQHYVIKSQYVRTTDVSNNHRLSLYLKLSIFMKQN